MITLLPQNIIIITITNKSIGQGPPTIGRLRQSVGAKYLYFEQYLDVRATRAWLQSNETSFYLIEELWIDASSE